MQMVPEIYYLLWFDLQSVNFKNITPKLMIFLQFNLHCKIIVKFVTENLRNEHKKMAKKVFEGNSTNKINLERRRNIKIDFQRYNKIN